MSLPNSLDYSIIIPAYNEEELLPRTIASIRVAMLQISQKVGEIIVVDNDSSDLTAKVAKEEGCRVVHESFRQIAKARNAGAKEAVGKYLFFIDADTVVPEKILQEAISKMEQSQVGGGGALLKFDRDHDRLFSGKILPILWNLLSEHLKLFAGSFIFCTRRLFVESGGFSEKIYAGEEIYFSQSVKKLCRKQNKDFLILRENPVVTSSRKLEWFSSTRIMLNLFLLLFFPLAIRFRSLCGFWYERPEGSGPQGS